MLNKVVSSTRMHKVTKVIFRFQKDCNDLKARHDVMLYKDYCS